MTINLYMGAQCLSGKVHTGDQEVGGLSLTDKTHYSCLSIG